MWKGGDALSKSAERAMTLLRILARNENGMGLMDLAGAAALDKSTAARLLESLQNQHFVHRDPQSKVYRVGAGMLSLAATINKRNRVLRLVRPFLEQLRDLSGETTSFYLRMGDGRVCVDGVESFHGSVRLLPLGEAAPFTAGGTTSKVILAFQPDEEIKRILHGAQLDEREFAQWREQLQAIRRAGYYAAIGERMAHVATMSAPIATSGGVTAAVTVSGPDDRWTIDAMTRFAPKLKEVASDLSALMHSADMSVYGVG